MKALNSEMGNVGSILEVLESNKVLHGMKDYVL